MNELDNLCINTIRTLSIDAIQKADSGHPGLPLGAAPMAYILWTRFLKHAPHQPQWADRDRFVLSGGHGSMLLYSLLHLSGYDLPLSELKNFRQWGSRTPGHPEFHLTPGVEATTGPLGQGSANAVGMAVAERWLAHRFNRPGFQLFDHMTYALVTDGDLMEGIAAEAGSLAGHWKLGKLVYLYDSNNISLDGPTSLTFTEDVGARYRAMGWHVQHVEDGDRDLRALTDALGQAKKNTTEPSLIIVRTTIGFGSPNKQGTSAVHGSPLGTDELKLTKKNLGWTVDEPFFVPQEVHQEFGKCLSRGRELVDAWQKLLADYKKTHPALAEELSTTLAGELPKNWENTLPAFKPGDKLATRQASGKVLNAIATQVTNLVGGDADLSCSTLSAIDKGGDFDGQSGQGRNLHFGVREHAMGSIANGMAYHGGIRPYSSTFFVFSDYMRPAVRLAAMNKLPAIYVWTHDSIGLGEDGPTHQPVEHLMALRSMPNLWLFRPADALETVESWRLAMLRNDGPSALVLTRQKLDVLADEPSKIRSGVARGAYVLKDMPNARGIFLATGSEVHMALQAQKILAEKQVPTRVVSMPCWQLFAKQDRTYQEQVVPPSISARVSIEAGSTLGWERYLGGAGKALGIDHFGASAPAEKLFVEFGLTAQGAAAALQTLL